jgi:methylated-DNA-[protein]-cysteine S-methyltransferase
MEYTYNSRLGPILIGYDDEYILSLRFDREQTQEYIHNQVIGRCIEQLNRYFDGSLREFDLPLNPEGTRFQKAVWKALNGIGYGQTATYGEIAAAIGNPKAARAVGGANNKNPIWIIIPCHRIIGSCGKMVGYGGGVDRKAALLSLEAGANSAPLQG